MNVRILTTSDSSEWNAYLDRLPGADIYHTPEYHRAHEVNGDGEARCFVAEDGGNLLLYPFMMRPICGTDLHDIETVYGYSGPLCTTLETTFHVMAWLSYGERMRALGVVAEFIRFNPMSENHRLVGGSCRITPDRETVVLDLSGTEDDLWQRYPSRQRNMVRKAIVRGGLSRYGGSTTDDMDTFKRLYHATMDRAGASEYYHFSDAYFSTLALGLGDRLKLFAVKDGSGRIVSAALFMVYRDRMHYHLAGTDAEFLNLAPNNLLLHGAALWGQEHGYRWLHLGGGLRPGEDDALFRFKASISNERRQFYVGKRVHDAAAYNRLCDEWMAAHGVVDRPKYFLLWRLE